MRPVAICWRRCPTDSGRGSTSLPTWWPRRKQRHPAIDFQVAEAPALDQLPRYDAVICDRLCHSVLDVRALLASLADRLNDDGRLFLTAFNYFWEVPTQLAEQLGWKLPAPTSNWLSESDFENLFEMTDLEVVRHDDRLMMPLDVPGLATALNRYLVKLPGVNLLSLYRIYVLRKRTGPRPERKQATVTVVVPARNEAGNIEAAVTRTPVMGGGTEIIFVEGGSSDGTWDKIQETIANNQKQRGPLKLSAYRQTGKGKGDAVRLGFSQGDRRLADDPRRRSDRAAGGSAGVLRRRGGRARRLPAGHAPGLSDGGGRDALLQQAGQHRAFRACSPTCCSSRSRTRCAGPRCCGGATTSGWRRGGTSSAISIRSATSI